MNNYGAELLIKEKKKKVLIVRVRAWHKSVILPQRLDFVLKLLKRNSNLTILDIKPIRKMGYYLGYLFSFLIMFPKVLLQDCEVAILENPYLTIFSPILKIRKKKVIVEYVDYYPANLNRLRKQRFFRYLIAKVICKNFSVFADVITTESKTGKRTLEYWGVPSHKIHILPVGINTQTMKYSDHGRNLIRKRLEISKDSFIIGYLGKLVNYYYLDRIIESIHLWKDRPTSTLLIIGDGPDKNNLEKLCNKYDIHAIFTGGAPHEEVSLFYSAMDIFVFPLDSLAIKLGEILSIGLPLVVIKGMAEDWIQDEFNGIVALNNSPNELKSALIRYLNMKQSKKDEIKRNQIKFAESVLSTKIIAKKYLALLN